MAHHLQGTLRGVQMTMWNPQTTFLLVHGEPECSFSPPRPGRVGKRLYACRLKTRIILPL
eukprot:1807154-Prymnesium_polylepis.1